MDKHIILKIFIITIFISIQIFHIIHDKFLKYPCLSWGRFNKTPLITLLWIFIMYSSFFIIHKNNVIPKIHIFILFILINLLIIFSNLDYSLRKSENNINTFSYIHHILSFITLVYCFILSSKLYSKFMNIFILSLLIIFFSLHQLWYILKNKNKQKFLKHISTCIELVIFVLVLGKGLITT
jgi:hypothetical protein